MKMTHERTETYLNEILQALKERTGQGWAAIESDKEYFIHPLDDKGAAINDTQAMTFRFSSYESSYTQMGRQGKSTNFWLEVDLPTSAIRFNATNDNRANWSEFTHQTDVFSKVFRQIPKFQKLHEKAVNCRLASSAFPSKARQIAEHIGGDVIKSDASQAVIQLGDGEQFRLNLYGDNKDMPRIRVGTTFPAKEGDYYRHNIASPTMTANKSAKAIASDIERRFLTNEFFETWADAARHKQESEERDSKRESVQKIIDEAMGGNTITRHSDQQIKTVKEYYVKARVGYYGQDVSLDIDRLPIDKALAILEILKS